MMSALLVFAVLCLLTIGMMMVAAAAVLPPQRPDPPRIEAEERGIALLRSWLTPEQDEQWMREGAFEVNGCDTGKRYRITNFKSMNVCELDRSGHSVKRWCFLPEGPELPTGDVLLAQKIALETMEGQALTVAKRFRGA
jgi:hypothetical protein